MRKKIRLISALLVASALCMTESMQAVCDVSSVRENESSQQKRQLTGTIEDTFGPVPGASIMVKGTTAGTISDVNGNYALDVAEGDMLVVSFLGYITQEIRVTEQRILNITIEEDAKKLDEVVVTALGIKKEAKKLGYAMSTIAADDLVKTGTPNFASSLYGKASGVRIQAAPGGGSSAVSISVRGMNSISGSNQPLIVVDGIPIRNGDANSDSYWDNPRIQGNGLTDINPEDIETLSILKGASASALYGSEAANGVVLITTKSGTGKKGVSIDFNMTFGIDKAAYLPEIQTVFGPGVRREARSGEWLTGGGFKTETYKGQEYTRPEYETHDMYGPKYDGRDVLYWDGSVRKYEPWKNGKGWNDLFRTGSSGTYNLAITAGGENSSTRFSYTYHDEQRLQRKSDMGRHSFNLSGGLKVIPRIRLEYNMSYMTRKDTNRPLRFTRLTNNYWGMFSSFQDVNHLWDMTETSLGYRNVFGPNEKTFTPDESFLWNISGKSLVEEYFWSIRKKRSEERTNRLIGNLNVITEIYDGLTFNVRLGTDYTTDCIENKDSSTHPLSIKKEGGGYSIENKRYEIYYGEAILNYAKDLNETWGVSASVGYNLREEKMNNVKIGTEGGLSVENWFHIDASMYSVKKTEIKLENFLRQAFFGMAGVGFKNYLFFEGTIRSEKSSTLLSGENTYTYPSGNLSFLVSEALGDKKPDWMDYLKTRVSYGIVGNAPEIYKASFAYKQDVINNFTFNQMQEDLPNAKLKPEEKHEIEFGLEGKFLRNRLGFEATYYRNVIKDQILKTTTPWSSGARSMMENVGELQNRGWEFSLYGTPVRTRDFQWDIRANLSFNKNKVNKLMNGIDELQHDADDGGAIRLVSRVGESAGDIMVYVPLEINGQQVVGTNGLYIIDKSEHKKVGNTSPNAVGGIVTSFNWKSFFVDMGVDFSIGGDVVNKPYQYMMDIGYIKESLPYRDAAHGGMTYHYADPGDFNSKKIAGASGGGKDYDDGMILPGVKEDGTPNDVIVSANMYYDGTFGWGAWEKHTTYKYSVFDNSYVKMRELTFGYSLPAKLSSKLSCKHLTVSVYGRNLFYFYKNLPIFDAEAIDGTRWDKRYQIGGATASTRSFGISLRAGF